MATAASLACLLGATAAQASDRVYWAETGRIVFANADGSGEVQKLATGATEAHLVEGATIDPATDRIYWIDRVGNQGSRKILFANLDGSGGGELNIAGTDSVESTSLAIDPVGRKIYWGGRFSGNISFADLDGSGGETFESANTSFPSGVAIDPVGRRLYWVNGNGPAASTVSFANLDRPGEGSLPIGTAEANDAYGAAIDPVGRRIYWANKSGNRISYANLDGSGGGILNTQGAAVGLPSGVAVDPVARRVYWANRSAPVVDGTISFANIDGSGGGNLLIDRHSQPRFPLLFFSPQPTSPVTVSGGSVPGSQLTCTNGTWSVDAIEASFYSTPDRFTYQWSRNGTEVPGATGPTFTAAPLAGGDYRCHVIASNSAGSNSEASPPHRVSPVPGSLALELATSKIRPGAVRVAIVNTGPVDVAGSLSGRVRVKPPGKPRRFVGLAAESFQLAAGATTVVRLPLSKPMRRQLLSRRKLSVALSATFAPPLGAPQVTERGLTPRLLRQNPK